MIKQGRHFKMKTKAPKIPRPEHPRPQFEREDWINLNGKWSFDFDFGVSGLERNFQKSVGFTKQINVPFCPESKLSGIAYTDFMRCVWYQRTIEIPFAWDGRRIILHFGGVDYETDVFVDGKLAGRHWGGMGSFEFDITHLVKAGTSHNLVVRAYDDTRISGNPAGGTLTQPAGKQCVRYESYAAAYTRTTGIWQTVWLEAAGKCGLESCQIVPDLDGSKFIFTPKYHEVRQGFKFRVLVKDGSKVVGRAEASALDNISCETVLKSSKAWSPESPFLYDVELSVIDAKGKIVDSVKSYAGLRKVHVEGNRMFLNNKPVFLRFVLDQGFYPDGVWTAPSDGALKRDIELSMKAGFNGARLHQKVFEERFHYWADKLGYLTWGESASWGANSSQPLTARNFLPEWAEAIVRDRNHPSIIAWTPLNETHQSSDFRVHNRLHLDCYKLSKMLDPTRPVNDASGFIHVKTDLWTSHDYTQDPEELLKRLAPTEGEPVLRSMPEMECDYTGQPYFVAEFGGIKWIAPENRPFADNSWGYGDAPKNLGEFYVRLEGLVAAINSQPYISGWCYTQLTDVEQEQNGLYNYDRSSKFDMKKIHAIFTGGH
jgi:beta-galactosidase/beta-glucuronidase